MILDEIGLLVLFFSKLIDELEQEHEDEDENGDEDCPCADYIYEIKGDDSLDDHSPEQIYDWTFSAADEEDAIRLCEDQKLDSQIADQCGFKCSCIKAQQRSGIFGIQHQNEDLFSNEESLEADLENDSESSDVEVPDPPKPVNVKRVTVSGDDVDADSSEEESVDVRPVAQEQDDDELHDDGEIESSMEDDDMFSDDVKVRPYVKTLLDKHGQVTAQDLLEEMRSLHDMIKAK